MLAQAATNFIENIRQQGDWYQQLVELAGYKKAALIKGELKDIEGITKVERGIIVNLGRLEEDRLKAHKVLAEQLGEDPSELSLSVLVEKLEEPVRGELTAVGDQLMELVGKLREANETNTMLIEQSLDYINYAVDLLTAVDELPTYPNQGNSATAARLFDKKI